MIKSIGAIAIVSGIIFLVGLFLGKGINGAAQSAFRVALAIAAIAIVANNLPQF